MSSEKWSDTHWDRPRGGRKIFPVPVTTEVPLDLAEWDSQDSGYVGIAGRFWALLPEPLRSRCGWGRDPVAWINPGWF